MTRDQRQFIAERREVFEPTKPWEILATFFGYFAVAKDIPAILRLLSIPKIVPQSIKTQLLRWNSNSDFWFLVFFTVITIIMWVWLVPRKKEIREKEKEDIIKKVSKTLRRQYLIRIIRSFGLVLLRGFILSRLHVRSYGTFKRPPPPLWPLEPDRLKSIDRISLASGVGVEFQYSADFTHLIIKEHPKNSDKFGDSKTRPPSWGDVKILMIASNIFPFWFLVFLLKRPLVWFKKNFV